MTFDLHEGHHRHKLAPGFLLSLVAIAHSFRIRPLMTFDLHMMMTFMKVKGHQRLNVVNVALWLPNLVRKNP